MMGFGFGGMMLGGLLMLVFWAVVIVGAVWLIATVVRSGPSGAQPMSAHPSFAQTPREILQMRYAKGEITKEQYEQMKRDLGS